MSGGGGGSTTIISGSTAVSGGTTSGIAYKDGSGNLAISSTFLNKADLAYDPANYFPSSATKQFWAKCWDSTKVLDASGVAVTNGTAVKTLVDSDGVTNIFQQGTAGNRPTWSSSLIGGFGGLQITSGKALPGLVNTWTQNKSSVTVGIVVARVGSGKFQPFYEENNANTQDRIGCINHTTNQWKLNGSIDDGATVSNLTASISVVNQYDFVLFEINGIRGTSNVYVNGEPVYGDHPSVAAGQNYPNTTSGSNSIGSTGDTVAFNLIEIWMYSGGVLSSAMRQQLALAVKAKFSLTSY